MNSTAKRKKIELKDRKNPFVYAFWSLVNKICISVRFEDFQVIGREYLPKDGPFLLVSNHITRWDGLIVYELIGRPANFMVSPNELLGPQGAVLASMGSFPADPRVDFISYALSIFKKGQGMVVFPEGNIFRDGNTHPFKPGAARIALAAAAEGINLPIIPAAIHYTEDGRIAQIALGEPIYASEYDKVSKDAHSSVMRLLSDRLHREVCFLRNSLGSLGDKLALFIGSLRHRWPALLKLSKNEIVIAESFGSESKTRNQNENAPAIHPSANAVLLTVPLPERKIS